MHKYSSIICILLSISLIACNGSKKGQKDNGQATGEKPTQTENTVWMEMNPVQCMGNPWEQMSGYVKKEEADFVMKHFSGKGVSVKKVVFKKTMEYVCEACSCPRGDTMYLLIERASESKMADLGFKYSEGP